MKLVNINGSLGLVEITVRDGRSEKTYSKALYRQDISGWKDPHNTLATTSLSQKLENFYESNLGLTIAAQVLGIGRGTLKFWCEKKKIKAENVDGRLWRVDKSEIERILGIYQEVGGPQRLFSRSEAAEFIGIEGDTLNNYLRGGVPVPHIDESDIQEAISEVKNLRYYRKKKRLCLNPYTLVKGGDQYLDEKTVEALMILNEVVVNGWIPIQQYARIVAEEGGRHVTPQTLYQLYKWIKHLCYKGRISAAKGLNSRAWYVEPTQANREALEGKIRAYLQHFGQEGIDFIRGYLKQKKFFEYRAKRKREEAKKRTQDSSEVSRQPSNIDDLVKSICGAINIMLDNSRPFGQITLYVREYVRFVVEGNGIVNPTIANKFLDMAMKKGISRELETMYDLLINQRRPTRKEQFKISQVRLKLGYHSSK